MQALIKRVFKNKLLGKTFRLSVITLLSNFLSFLIPVYIAYLYGVSKQTDNFFFSYGVITFVNIIFSTAISNVTVPFVKEKMEDKVWFNKFISSFVYYCGKVLGSVSVVCLIGLLLTSNFLKSEFIYYLALSVPIFFLTVLNSFCYGILNSLEQFNMAAMSPFSRAIIIFITIYFLKSSLGIVAVILGYNIGELFKLLHLLYVIKSRNSLTVSFKDRDYSMIRNFVKEGSYQSISTAISCASPLIDKIVASFLVVGSLSLLDYGDKVVLVFTILLNSFLVIILSKWSAEVVKKTFSLRKMNLILMGIMSVTAICFIVIFLFKNPVANVLYPKLSADKKGLIAIIFSINMAGFIFNSANQAINMANIAFKATSVLIKISVIKTIINFVFDIILGFKFGVIGIAFSTVLVHFCGLIINYFVFNKKVLPKMTSSLDPVYT